MSFQLDPFQKAAIEWIEKKHSVLVSAPTGAGKTLIAESAIRSALEQGKNVIYTAPIKALSNQKYRDFRAQYGEKTVGILTGDVSLNSDARILIMTTEIYRNCLFENSKRIQNTAWIIFDEIHYLDDPDRGSVWEEALLFTPKNTAILALSATVPNVEQLAEWISSIHNREVKVVIENKRPVPLDFTFQCQGKFINSMKQLRRDGYLQFDNWKHQKRKRQSNFLRLRAKPNRLDTLLSHLKEINRLPAVYFAFGRRRTEYLAVEAQHFDFLTTDERTQIISLFNELLSKYDLKGEKTAQEMWPLIERGVAYHHAGMLPTLKEIIEQLFTSRLIKVIFTTETFALGINMPARTVIFDELEKYYGTGFKNLTTRDFYQMAGRAGRRGMDTRGDVYMRINPQHISFQDIRPIIYGDPEPIRSQLNTTYATLLNLYKNLGPKFLDIYPKTFHYFQSQKKQRKGALGMIERKLEMLKSMAYLDDQGITPKGEFAMSLFGYELYMAELHADHIFDDLTVTKLVVLISSLIFEPRKGDHLPRLNNSHKRLKNIAEDYQKHIYRKELKYKVLPKIKSPHFNLAPVVEAWVGGMAFDDLFRFTGVDEGELVRHFRMIIQLLRELRSASHISDKLKATAGKALQAINRDVVDAEKQLRV